MFIAISLVRDVYAIFYITLPQFKLRNSSKALGSIPLKAHTHILQSWPTFPGSGESTVMIANVLGL